MIDIDFSKYIRNCNTSYKIFLLLYLFNNISLKKEFSFHELSCGIVATSWNYINSSKFSFGKNDKLIDIVENTYVITNNVTPFSNENEVYNFYFKCNNALILKKLNTLTLYAPYRLLVDDNLQIILKNELDRKKNNIIKEYSQKNEYCLYKIEDKKIIINDWLIKYIKLNKIFLIDWLKNEILMRYLK